MASALTLPPPHGTDLLSRTDYALNDEQKAKVQEWIAAGLKLSEIQDRLGKEYELRLSYMDLRLLVDDLKLTPERPGAAGAGRSPRGRCWLSRGELRHRRAAEPGCAV